MDRVRRCEPLLPCGLPMFFLFFVFRLTFTFQLLDKLWSQVSSLLPPGTCLQSSSCIRCSIPTARRFSLNVASSLRIFTSMHSGGLELCKLSYSRHEDNLLHHRGDVWPENCISMSRTGTAALLSLYQRVYLLRFSESAVHIRAFANHPNGKTHHT